VPIDGCTYSSPATCRGRWCLSQPRLERARPLIIALLAAINLWLFVAYELLIMRHGVYGSLATTWRYAVGLF
jgi:hypothetical protein